MCSVLSMTTPHAPGRIHGSLTTMATSTPIPPNCEKLNLQRLMFHGTLKDIEAQITKADIPATWGPAVTLRLWIASHIPLGKGWKGELIVTGYRTPPNDQGTLTAYVSIAVKPQRNT